ncbi:nicotinamide riboside transporter PnuC [Marinoscillum furvescens]|uniref:Nicotinamide riboside transporter PnuC n=1 Tax=Marinoscillum furvescens DSM 4134 TaxID=1122208 RepID=A0A3D9L686_MARFU|nr:nicotinamide riboside transporter PnuC [Marinoscillum furvescens]REE01614.1 nicotinamide mononucleotide transporter [Marinoscillum furvescens DSM 4134]
MQEFFHQFISQVTATSWLEAVAVLFGLLSVWYSKQENILVYPTGIIGVVIAVYLTLRAGLYAEAGINTYYFIMSVYGWYYWTHADPNKPQVPVTASTKQEHWIAAGITLGAFVLIRFGLDFTDSDVPNLDAITTATAITGMWLMAKKKLENWVYWIITDLIATPLYFYKGLYFFSFQFLVFTALAIWGYVSWRKSLLASAS